MTTSPTPDPDLHQREVLRRFEAAMETMVMELNAVRATGGAVIEAIALARAEEAEWQPDPETVRFLGKHGFDLDRLRADPTGEIVRGTEAIVGDTLARLQLLVPGSD